MGKYAMTLPNVTHLNEQLEDLPVDLREKVAKYISEHLEDIQDEMRWDESFKRTAGKLSEFARNARQEIKDGLAEEMDFKKL
jgi:hypothetical protein